DLVTGVQTCALPISHPCTPRRGWIYVLGGVAGEPARCDRRAGRPAGSWVVERHTFVLAVGAAPRALLAFRLSSERPAGHGLMPHEPAACRAVERGRSRRGRELLRPGE